MSSTLSNHSGDETFLDSALRPSSWDDYIGQEHTKKNLEILLGAAKERGHAPEHVLFWGPPGLGKTTLAHLIARELGSSVKITSGPAIERVGDLASVLTNLTAGDILFIDEIHRLNKAVEEVLYPAMEAGVLNIIIGKGPGARAIQLDLPPFTLVAATTKLAGVSSPLRSRFSGGAFQLVFYTPEELQRILMRSASILGITLSPAVANIIGKRSRSTPRIANHYLKRCRDFAQVHKKEMTREIVEEALAMLGVDEYGLSREDATILTTLVDTFGGGPVGLSTIATALSAEASAVEDVYEPYLIKIGFLERTPRGRVATKRAYEYLRKDYPFVDNPRLL